MIYAEQVVATLTHNVKRWQTFATAGGPAGRTRMDVLDQEVNVRVRHGWASVETVNMMRSATALNIAVSATNVVATAAYSVWSALFTQLSIGSQQGEIFRTRFSIIAADISAA